MLQKRKMRELAMQVLFLWDSGGELNRGEADQCLRDATPDEGLRRDALAMASGTWEQRAMIDERVERLGPHWPPRRQPAVDRNLIRMAVWELTNADTPPKVVLDEAIELAKIFSTEQSAGFVNGVLDAVFQEQKALLDEKSAAAHAGLEVGAPSDAPTVPDAGASDAASPEHAR